jgi:hypothetical protein
MESNGFILNILTIFDNSYILIAGIFEMRIHGMYGNLFLLYDTIMKNLCLTNILKGEKAAGHKNGCSM